MRVIEKKKTPKQTCFYFIIIIIIDTGGSPLSPNIHSFFCLFFLFSQKWLICWIGKSIFDIVFFIIFIIFNHYRFKQCNYPNSETDSPFSENRPDFLYTPTRLPEFFFQGAKSNCLRSEVRVLKVIQTLVLLHTTVGGVG